MSVRCEKGWSVERFERWVTDELKRLKYTCKGCTEKFVRSKKAHDSILNSILNTYSTIKSGERLTIDHKIPKAKGGTNALGNLTLLCRACNIRKGDSVRPVRKRKAPVAAWEGWS